MPVSTGPSWRGAGDRWSRRMAAGWGGVRSGWRCWRRRALLLQLLGTLIALGWVPGNAVKLAIMVVFWVIGFGRLSRKEFVAGALINLLFILMDRAALEQGIFQFRHPDSFGLPVYEFFIWGFYILHAIRFLDGPTPRADRRFWALGLAAAFGSCFLLLTDPSLLAVAAAAVLAASLVFFHEPIDCAYTVYVAAMGALVEYVGTETGQWAYPTAAGAGVPLWSFAMWGGIGLFTRRLLVPVLRGGIHSRPPVG